MFEWKQRLEALNKFRPLAKAKVDFDAELDAAESALSIEELIRIRKLYGATHYVTSEKRADLAGHLLYATTLHAVYDIAGLTAAETE